MHKLLESKFKEQTAEYWEKLLNDKDTCAMAVRPPSQIDKDYVHPFLIRPKLWSYHSINCYKILNHFFLLFTLFVRFLDCLKVLIPVEFIWSFGYFLAKLVDFSVLKLAIVLIGI